MPNHFYVASHTQDGGIFHFVLDDSGNFQFRERVSIAQPSYLCIEGNSLYALLREPFRMQSGVIAYEISNDGQLLEKSSIRPTHGAVAAHLISVDDRIYVANYLSGSVVLLPDRAVIYPGSGPNSSRQECSHPHCIGLSPDKQLICIADLGTDSLWTHSLDLTFRSRTALPPGCGPRHFVFSDDGKFIYCITELSSTVEVLQRQDNEFTHRASYSALPDHCTIKSHGAAIRLSSCGQYLYVSNRGHNSISTFSVDADSLHFLCNTPCEGISPRDFVICGDFLLCANELSNNIAIFYLDHGLPVFTGRSIDVDTPWGIVHATF